ncbi:MAG TPA: acyl-CoA dehydrogenase family protein, partial [Acidimicrobiales bacterium]|nr:acyl-CoA dehydrogenase family protein [Acidimicrobiales bacterium]
FNEVFFTAATVPDAAVVGGVTNGWAVANTTLMHERAGLGAGAGGGGGFGAMPGTVANNLDRRAGEFVTPSEPGAARRGGRGGGRGGQAQMLISMAQANGRIADATVRQDLARLHTYGEVARYNAERHKAVRQAGGDIPGMANIAKLSMSNIVRLGRDLGLRIIGPHGMLHGYDDEGRKQLAEATGSPFYAMVTGSALSAQAPPIYGGTDQVQRNIIGERVLGLPKEPSNDRVVPFSQLPKNA